VIRLQQWRKVENGGMTGGFCMKCFAPICHHCNKKLATEGCVPFVKKVEEQLRADQKLAAFMKLAGLDRPATPRALILPGTHQA
jgi:hypothetical protein